jgi:hypothetical protein
MSPYEQSVFINVPFDGSYQKLLDAIVYAVHDCGLKARTALEEDDGADVRIDKIYRLIDQCQYGIHDLSRTTLDSVNRLPRFNMPLELGVFLGARRFGTGRHKSRSVLILDRDQYRYQKFCSDIAGQDIRAHGNTVGGALGAVRNWLDTRKSASAPLPSRAVLEARYVRFRKDLPVMCKAADLSIRELSFRNYCQLVDGWILENPIAKKY